MASNTGDTAIAAAAGFMREDGTLDVEAMQKVLAEHGLKAVAEGVKEAKSIRKAQKERWETATAEDMTDEEKQTLTRIVDVLGAAPTGKDVLTITQADIDLFVEEAVSVKDADDMYEGRLKAIKAAIINYNLSKSEDADGTGVVASVKHGKKIVIQNMDKTPAADYKALADVVPASVWDSITSEVTTREVDTEKLEQAIGAGTVTLEQIAAIQPEPRIFKTMVVRNLKKGDDIG